MSKIKKSASQKSEYSVIYSGISGVDFSGDGSDIGRGRYSYLENMYRDYDGDGAGIVESIPGYRKLINLKGTCDGLYSYKNEEGHDIIVAHILNRLYQFEKSDIDNIKEMTIITGIQHRKSSAFVYGEAIYVLDGSNIFKLAKEYRAAVHDEFGGGIYIPTTHINGVEVAQRNLLTRKFKEKYVIGSADSLTFGTFTLKYVITDEEKRLCKIVGVSGIVDKEICIPSRTKIGDAYYSVTEIAPRAFEGHTKVTKITIAPGVINIGSLAFFGCSALEVLKLPDTVSEIGDGAFSDCGALTNLRLGLGTRKLGDGIFSGCTKLTTVSYGGSESEFETVENPDAIGARVLAYNVVDNSAVINIPINNLCEWVDHVYIGNAEITDYEIATADGLCTGIKLSFENKAEIEGQTAIIEGRVTSDVVYYERAGIGGFVGTVYSNIFGSVADVILGCRICASFDGRIFLSGNPYYPGYVFHSTLDDTGQNNPLYFGEFNYFCDGTANFGVTTMLKTGDSLAVFKETDDGAGSIFYHKAAATENNIIPKIYPVSYTHSGFPAKGASISFLDDPVFISDKGLSALEKKNINLERSIVTRSNNINPKFLTEDLERAQLAIWQGYLVISIDGNMYLADSRDTFMGKEGNTEYEWYFLSGIGSYTDDETVYRFASSAHEGYYVHDEPDSIVDDHVISAYDGEELIYFTIIGGKKYEAYPTEQKKGGTFHPATHIMVMDDLLFFATDSGDISVFNNDKRGVAPPHIQALEGFDPEEYDAVYGRRIHPYYYSSANHATRYALMTPKDNCGIPHLLKSTAKRSLTLKCRAVSAGRIKCEVGTDTEGYSEVCAFPNKDMAFSDIDFNSLSLSTNDVYTVSLNEKMKNWVEKQITLYTDEYQSPFGLYSIAYRFIIKGRIKNTI